MNLRRERQSSKAFSPLSDPRSLQVKFRQRPITSENHVFTCAAEDMAAASSAAAAAFAVNGERQAADAKPTPVTRPFTPAWMTPAPPQHGETIGAAATRRSSHTGMAGKDSTTSRTFVTKPIPTQSRATLTLITTAAHHTAGAATHNSTVGTNSSHSIRSTIAKLRPATRTGLFI